MKMNAVVAGVGMTRFGKHLESGLKAIGAFAGGAGRRFLRAFLEAGHDLGHGLDIDCSTEGGKALALVFVVELFDSECEDNVVEAGSNHGSRLVQCGRGAGAGIFDVDDRDLADARGAEDDLAADALLAGNEARATAKG